MDLLLIVVLIIFGGFALHGYIRGLVRMIYSLAAVFLTIGLASLMAPYGAEFLREQTPLYEAIQEKTMEILSQQLEEKTELEVSDLLKENGIEQVTAQMADAILQRLAWILALILVGILLGVLIHVLDLIAKLPGINTINHMGGLIVGVIEGLAIVWVLFFVAGLCQSSEWGSQVMTSIQDNVFLRLLYENNLIEQLVMRK
ncbi:MAG: CvpA family protein [Lachnospiraceae bacterium]|nr:CvpA family protein [Lachnospiraceae bacterium]